MSKSRTANEWEETLKLWGTSEDSKASFCRKNNIPLSTFQYHLQKGKKNVDDTGFVKVPIPIKEKVENPSVEIRTDYCTISMGENFDKHTLSVILKTLRAVSV